jgi:hypothetical protein
MNTKQEGTTSVRGGRKVVFSRRMLKIPRTARKSNEEVLKEAEENRRLITLIRKRQSKFVVHVWRRYGMEHIITT